MPKDTQPKNWAPGIPYLTAPTYSSSLNSSQRAALKHRDACSTLVVSNTPKGLCSLVKITPISSPSHPAVGQCGLFAASDLKPGSFVLQYLGQLHASPNSSESSLEPDPHAQSNYDLSLDREGGIGIDADTMGNEARFVNDYRGIVEKPNAEFREIWDERRGEKGMGVFVLPQGKSGKGKEIQKGQEILVSYGRGFWGARKDVEDG